MTAEYNESFSHLLRCRTATIYHDPWLLEIGSHLLFRSGRGFPCHGEQDPAYLTLIF